MIQQKPLTQKLFEQFHGGFGAAYPPGEPLPATGLRPQHVENDKEDFVTDRLPPTRKDPPQPLLTLALGRLNSLKAISPTRAKQIEQTIVALTGLLKTADDLIATVEQERCEAIGNRWEEMRVLGRKILGQMDTLISKVNAAMMRCNESMAAKVHAQTELQTHHLELSRMSRWASVKEIAAAEAQVEADRAIKQSADEVALADQRALAEAENAVRIAKAQVVGISREMDRCECELRGENYHDAEFGLSITPTLYQNS